MTALAVLLGHGIGYSASPAMHNAAFAALQIDARYELRDVEADALAAEVDALRRDHWLGANVTKPHKLAVCELVDGLGSEVERLGATNTIVRDGDRLLAHNTDLAALAAELPARPRRAVVLGAGGASRAAVAALADAGCTDITVVDRAHWPGMAGALDGADLLINATPIGTGSGDSPVVAELLRPDLAVLDLVYRPSPTRLVREARGAGAVARGGAGMLLRQAAASFELWTGRPAPIDVMRDALRAELGPGTDA
jgi:shikimate dehydrogenase